MRGILSIWPILRLKAFPEPDEPPPGWNICTPGLSTPDIQPGWFGVYLPPSNGNTFLGMTARDNNTWEDVGSQLLTPLSMDSCYYFKIDLAYQDDVAGYNMQPIVLKIFGEPSGCLKNHLLWESPPVANEEWLTYEFFVHPDEFDIAYIVMEVGYVGLSPYWGYCLMDNIRITTAPDIDLGNDTTLAMCEIDSLLLNAGSGFTQYVWQDGSADSIFSVTTSGTYWVEVTNAEGCTATDTIEVIVEEYAEMVTDMIDSLFVCEGQEVNIWVSVTNGVPPYTYTWSGLPDTTSTANLIADSTGFYTVLITDKCGLITSDSMKIIVFPPPEINLGNDTLICLDGSYTLHAGSGYSTYLWQDGSQDSTFTLYEPGIYWVEVSSALGCVERDSIQIQLFPAIQLNIGNDTILCQGETITLNGGGDFTSYYWQDGSTDSTLAVSASGLYWLEVTDVNGCSETDSVQITFNPWPVISLGQDKAICQGEELILDPGPGYLSYLWQNGDTTQYFTVNQSGNYHVTVSNGCGNDTDTIHVDVNPVPDLYLGNDTTLCGSSSYLLYPDGQYSSYLWQDNSTTPFYTITATGSYWLTVSNGYECEATDEIYVILSNPLVDLGPDTFVCENDSLILDAGNGYTQYYWNNLVTEQTFTVHTPGTYFVTVFDEYNCESYDEVFIEQSYPPYPDLGPDQGYCAGKTLVLFAPDGNYSIYWNHQPGGQHFTVNQPGEYILTLVNECDSISDAITIEEYPLPEVNLGEDAIIMQGETLELDAGEGYDAYTWQDGSGGQYFLITEQNMDTENPYYYVEVKQGMCLNSDTVKVELFEVWVPIVITPNGDGWNDVFEPDMNSWNGIQKHSMEVFSRWGEKVWESDDFPSGWDGKQNGRYVSEGTYYWILEVYYGPQMIRQTLKGSLTILGT
ncbi:MAG: gliding motility-associated C-terminal domain-containing protein [Bacteroidales bacterium]